MNYLKIYCALIRKAQNRKTPKTYTEKHHIFPVSIFGKNNKIVKLTAREHYIAHALLEKVCIKRYGIEHIRSQKMIRAFWCMNAQKTKNEYLNSRLYESSRIKFISLIAGKKLSNSHVEKIVKNLKSRKWWNNGVVNKHCPECPGDGWVLGRLNINVGRVLSEESKRKISKANSGKKLSEESKKNISKAISGKKWWNNGVIDKHSKKCPGEGWVLGRIYSKSLKNRRWWTNGMKRAFREKCPGEGWVLGYNL